MGFLLLRPQDLKGLVSMGEAIDAIEQGYREAASYPVINAPRRRVHSPAGVRVSTFPGGIHALGVIGVMEHTEIVKQEETTQALRFREHPVYVLHDSSSGELLSILIGEIDERDVGYTSIMALRTGATSGVGFRLLARNGRTVGLYGTGGQALNQILALKTVRPITHVKVFSRDPEHRRQFAERAGNLLKVDITPVDHPREVMRGVDIVISATNSNIPVFSGEWIEPGQHITSIIGSNVSLVKGGWLRRRRRENDDATIQRADVLVVNLRETIMQDEQGDLFEPLEKGLIKWEQIYELGEVLNGTRPGRTSDEQVTMHKNNVGLGIADLAVAKRAFELARKHGRGTEMDLPEPGKQ